MIIEGSKHLISDENFGLIMNPSQTLLISIFPKARLQTLAAFQAASLLVCHAGAR